MIYLISKKIPKNFFAKSVRVAGGVFNICLRLVRVKYRPQNEYHSFELLRTEEFFSMLRFENRGKLDNLGLSLFSK